MKNQRISMIAAIGRNRVLGNNNELLFPNSDDFKYFKETTSGHSIIMGYKTYESIGKPLPNRHNIVMSQDENLSIEGCDIAHSKKEALALAKEKGLSDEVFIIGGGIIYTLFLPEADKLYLTLVDQEKEGDTFFPPFEGEFPIKKVIRSETYDGVIFEWAEFTRS